MHLIFWVWPICVSRPRWLSHFFKLFFILRLRLRIHIWQLYSVTVQRHALFCCCFGVGSSKLTLLHSISIILLQSCLPLPVPTNLLVSVLYRLSLHSDGAKQISPAQKILHIILCMQTVKHHGFKVFLKSKYRILPNTLLAGNSHSLPYHVSSRRCQTTTFYIINHRVPMQLICQL